MGFWAESFAAHGILLSFATSRSTIRAKFLAEDKGLFYNCLRDILKICAIPERQKILTCVPRNHLQKVSRNFVSVRLLYSPDDATS
jgi:hypothetical protein